MNRRPQQSHLCVKKNQTDRQTDKKQINKQTEDKQANKQTEDKQTSKQTNRRQTNKQTDKSKKAKNKQTKTEQHMGTYYSTPLPISVSTQIGDHRYV